MKKKIIFMCSVVVLAISVVALARHFMPSGIEILKPDSTKQTQTSENKGVLKDKIAELNKTGDYKGAIAALNAAADTEITEEAKLCAVDSLKALEEKLHNEILEGVFKYDYQGGAAKIREFYGQIPNRVSWTVGEKTKKLEKMCVDYSNLVEYKGAVEHIFFHPLIAYKELAFDGDYQSKGLDDYFTTIPEFKEVIRQLYEKNYVLIDMHLLYDVDAEGKPVKKTIMLPQGKRPVVISIDDLNFYPYMKEHGMPHGYLIQDGKIMTYSDRPDGSKDISDDNDIVPILNKFVDERPEFAFGGIKGYIASTGYNGTLGFRTDQLDSPDYQENFKKAKEMADLLKSMGWRFASHSYGHGSPAKQSYEKLCRDDDLWIKEVVPIVGETDIYIYPYGELIKVDDPKHQHIVQNGFKMFCGVQSKSAYLKYYKDSILMQRRNIDGIAMKGGRLDNMFDVAKILDPDRPK